MQTQGEHMNCKDLNSINKLLRKNHIIALPRWPMLKTAGTAAKHPLRIRQQPRSRTRISESNSKQYLDISHILVLFQHLPAFHYRVNRTVSGCEQYLQYSISCWERNCSFPPLFDPTPLQKHHFIGSSTCDRGFWQNRGAHNCALSM